MKNILIIDKISFIHEWCANNVWKLWIIRYSFTEKSLIKCRNCVIHEWLVLGAKRLCENDIWRILNIFVYVDYSCIISVLLIFSVIKYLIIYFNGSLIQGRSLLFKKQPPMLGLKLECAKLLSFTLTKLQWYTNDV